MVNRGFSNHHWNVLTNLKKIPPSKIHDNNPAVLQVLQCEQTDTAKLTGTFF